MQRGPRDEGPGRCWSPVLPQDPPIPGSLSDSRQQTPWWTFRVSEVSLNHRLRVSLQFCNQRLTGEDHLAILLGMAKYGRTLALLVLTSAMPLPALAQGETTSAIVGTVMDPTGGAIPDATVTLTSAENGLKRSVQTDDSGRYSFPQLMPGTYSVRVE